MIKKWEVSKIDEKKTREIAEENNISTLMAQILMNRGFEKHDDIQSFLHPALENLYDPFLFKDMDIAVDRIIEARDNNEKVTVYGDYDVDGITSITVLKKFLSEMDVDVDYYLPSRLEEGYGLNNDAIKKIADNKTNLMITVDCGISAYEEIEYAKSFGIDVIVTDHHECPEILPNALAVVDHKRQDNTYPFAFLAGVGVTFKLIQAISLKLGFDRKKYLKYLDIVCLGTVADIVPIVDENRIIVNYGLILMRETRNIGLQALIKTTGYNKINSTSISFGLAPRINACGRMGKADMALELLLTNDVEKAIQIANELNNTNKERQEVEKRIIEEAINKIENEKLFENDVIIVSSENWHHGVIGIVASKITEMYYKPSILICVEDGVGKGSGRSIEGFDLHEALSACSESLLKFGGHEMAIGLSINETEIEKFSNKMNDFAKDKNIKNLLPIIKADAEIKLEDASINVVKEFETLEPYGEANPAPIFLYKNVKVDGVRLLSNEKHLKLSLKDKNYVIDAIAFNMGDKKYTIKIGDKVDLLSTLEINEFNNMEKVQLNVKDIKKSL